MHFAQVVAAVEQTRWPMIMVVLCEKHRIARRWLFCILPARYPMFTETEDHVRGSENNFAEQLSGKGHATCKLDPCKNVPLGQIIWTANALTYSDCVAADRCQKNYAKLRTLL